MKRAKKQVSIVRRSIDIPQARVDEVTAVAKAFDRAIQEMVSDPEIQTECRAIARDFLHTGLDSPPGVTAAESGLPEDTVFLCFQIRSIDYMRFRQPRSRRIGALPPKRMAQVEDALRNLLAL